MRSRLPTNLGDNPTNNAGSRPYLKITGALALRFSVAQPTPADLPVRTAASAPSLTVSSAPETPSPVAHNPPASDSSLDVKPREPVTTQSEPVTENPPPAILPDDTRPATHPEDFLPYFQFPSSNGDLTIIVPATATRPSAPGQLPPSSATYQQR